MNTSVNLKNARKGIPALAGIALLWSGMAAATPMSLSATQMDAVAAAGVETVEGFVCPVIKTDGVLNSPRSGTLGGGEFYTIGGPDVRVPVHATNGDGSGSPGGPFTGPGDTTYTAIWSK
jgi:hypothetical protein